MRTKRRKIWIDGFQTKLSLRIACYFVLYQIAIWAMVLIDEHVRHAMEAVFGGAGWGFVALMKGSVLFLSLLFIYDAIKFSHRLVGPLYRFRKTIQTIAAGEEVDLVNLRRDDFLQEMKDEFNEMLKLLEQRGAVTLKENAAEQSKQQATAS
jgi:nitrogen fixation/metabolism regulation signal transduction histidine kinase